MIRRGHKAGYDDDPRWTPSMLEVGDCLWRMAALRWGYRANLTQGAALFAVDRHASRLYPGHEARMAAHKAAAKTAGVQGQGSHHPVPELLQITLDHIPHKWRPTWKGRFLIEQRLIQLAAKGKAV